MKSKRLLKKARKVARKIDAIVQVAWETRPWWLKIAHFLIAKKKPPPVDQAAVYKRLEQDEANE